MGNVIIRGYVSLEATHFQPWLCQVSALIKDTCARACVCEDGYGAVSLLLTHFINCCCRKLLQPDGGVTRFIRRVCCREKSAEGPERV